MSTPPASTTVTLPKGMLLHPGQPAALSDEGVPAFALTKLRQVGIVNLAEVIDYQQTRLAGTISHFVRFDNGGTLAFAYTDIGKLLHLRLRGVHATLSDAGDLLVSSSL